MNKDNCVVTSEVEVELRGVEEDIEVGKWWWKEIDLVW